MGRWAGRKRVKEKPGHLLEVSIPSPALQESVHPRDQETRTRQPSLFLFSQPLRWEMLLVDRSNRFPGLVKIEEERREKASMNV